MSHFYGQSIISGGRLIQGNVHDYHHEEVHHHYAQTSNESISTLTSWFSSLNFATTLQGHCNKRTPSTGEWLLANDKFRQWCAPESQVRRVLWCRGDPGTGKTILCSTIIQHLRRVAAVDSAVVYCFFDYARRNQLTAETIVAELLLQLFLADISKFRDVLLNLYNEAEGGRRKPTLEELTTAFNTSCSRIGRIFVVVDALDECDHVVRRRLFTALDLLANKNCQMLIMSRPHIQPTVYLNKLIAEFTELEIRAHRLDLQLFLHNRITDSEDLESVIEDCPGGAQAVVDQIIDNANFSFLAAEMRVNSIQFAVTLSELTEALNAGNSDLSQLYSDTLRRIDSQQGSRAKIGRQVLDWLSVTKRPLTIGELCHAIGLQNCGRECSPTQIPSADTILGSCYGLVTQDRQSGQVRLLHYTLLEFLEKQSTFSANDLTVLECCLKCLSSSELSQLTFQSAPSLSFFAAVHMRVLRRLPLVLYAAQHWIEHLSGDYETSDCLLVYLEHGHNIQIWQILLDFHNPRILKRLPAVQQIFDAPRTCELLGARLSLAMGWMRTFLALLHLAPSNELPLIEMAILAISQCSEEGTRMVLEQGANASSTDADGYSLLYHAATNHFLAGISLLMRHGADLTHVNNRQETLLHACFRRKAPQQLSERFYDTFKLLLGSGIEINKQNTDGDTALHLAIRTHASNEVIKLLADYGAALDVLSSEKMTSLEYLTQNPTRAHLLEHFLTTQVNQDIIASNGDNTLHLAVKYVADEAVQSVLSRVCQRGVDINAQNRRGQTALHLAMHDSRLPVVEMLLQVRVNTVIQDRGGDTPLHVAIKSKASISVIKQLLTYQSQNRISATGIQNVSQNNALHLAIGQFPSQNHLARLLRSGHDDTMGQTGKTPALPDDERLSHLVSLLFAHEPHVNMQNKNGDTILHMVVCHDPCKLGRTFELLMSHRPNMFVCNAAGNDVLRHAILHTQACTSCLAQLLAAGADLNARSKSGETILHQAVMLRKVSYIDLFLQKQLDVNARDSSGNTALHFVVVWHFYKHNVSTKRSIADEDSLLQYLMRLLQEHADVNAQNTFGDTPLHLLRPAKPTLKATRLGYLGLTRRAMQQASYPGETARQRIVQVLLKHGAREDVKNIAGHTPLDAVEDQVQYVKRSLGSTTIELLLSGPKPSRRSWSPPRTEASAIYAEDKWLFEPPRISSKNYIMTDPSRASNAQDDKPTAWGLSGISFSDQTHILTDDEVAEAEPFSSPSDSGDDLTSFLMELDNSKTVAKTMSVDEDWSQHTADEPADGRVRNVIGS